MNSYKVYECIQETFMYIDKYAVFFDKPQLEIILELISSIKPFAKRCIELNGDFDVFDYIVLMEDLERWSAWIDQTLTNQTDEILSFKMRVMLGYGDIMDLMNEIKLHCDEFDDDQLMSTIDLLKAIHKFVINCMKDEDSDGDDDKHRDELCAKINRNTFLMERLKFFNNDNKNSFR